METVYKVLKVAPNTAPEVVEIKNDLRSLQEAVSIGAPEVGLIELVGIEEGVDLLLNEEGKLIGLPMNRVFGNDILCGVFYVVGVSGDSLCSLSDEMIKKYTEIFESEESTDIDSFMIKAPMSFFGFW